MQRTAHPETSPRTPAFPWTQGGRFGRPQSAAKGCNDPIRHAAGRGVCMEPISSAWARARAMAQCPDCVGRPIPLTPPPPLPPLDNPAPGATAEPVGFVHAPAPTSARTPFRVVRFYASLPAGPSALELPPRSGSRCLSVWFMAVPVWPQVTQSQFHSFSNSILYILKSGHSAPVAAILGSPWSGRRLDKRGAQRTQRRILGQGHISTRACDSNWHEGGSHHAMPASAPTRRAAAPPPRWRRGAPPRRAAPTRPRRRGRARR
jgi:hypothetical protein